MRVLSGAEPFSHTGSDGAGVVPARPVPAETVRARDRTGIVREHGRPGAIPHHGAPVPSGRGVRFVQSVRQVGAR